MKEFVQKYMKFIIGIPVAVVLLFLFYIFFNLQAPHSFERKVISVPEGTSVKAVAEVLEEEGLIKSEFWFTVYAVLLGKDKSIQSGEYNFTVASDTPSILRRLSQGDFGFKILSIRLLEGSTRMDMVEIFEDNLIDFDTEYFIEKTDDLEGYLFPDTYYIVENAKAKDIINLLTSTFESKTADIREQTKLPFEDVVTMASIVEREADASSKEEVANILWKRIGIDMALQVDAPFIYERDKGTFDLSTNDLLEDSEYNTYTRTGLTPTPISNPGLASLEAAAFPEYTDYLFFLTGHDGNMYYGKDFSEHSRNKSLYLR